MEIETFISTLKEAFRSGSLLKCTLSKPTRAAAAGLKNIYLRPVAIRSVPKLSFTYRYQTRDEVKNHNPEEAAALLLTLLGPAFLNADLFTTTADYSLAISKEGAAVLKVKKSMKEMAPETTHNREKRRLLDPSAPWLHALGITGVKGEVLPASQDKWRQINKYLEIIANLLKNEPLPQDAHIADMGSGKGYLTFALYDYLVSVAGMTPDITGIELRAGLVDLCNTIAKASGFDGLHFVARDIATYQPARMDMLIALHACDTATDLALASGIRAKAKILVVAPCCHKQIRKEMDTRNELAPVLRHGILEERQAEIVTDGIRALLLEASGYKTNVFEFISTEHTAKNIMITATEGLQQAQARKKEALARIAALKEGFGIREHYLEKLLAGPS